MAFEDLLTDTIDIYRAQKGAGVTTAYGASPFESGVQCLIQPYVPEYSSKTDYNFGRQYNCLLLLGTDINPSDRVIDEFGKIYQVSGSLNRPYGQAVSHLTVLLTEEANGGVDA